MMRVRFSNFWEGFDPSSNLFSEYMRIQFPELKIIRNNVSKVEIEFFSVFPNLRQRIQSKLTTSRSGISYNLNKSNQRIWFCGENQELPSTGGFDQYYSHNDDEMKNAFYFPLWKFDIDWLNSGRINLRLGKRLVPSDLISKRSVNNAKKNRVCFFVRNLTPERQELITQISRLIPVDVYGSTKHNRITSKLDISKNYKYILCPENTISPGYTTEKLVEGYFSEAIPIYFGSLPHSNSFNPNAFLYFDSFAQTDALLETLKLIDDELWEQKYSSALFTSPQDVNELRGLNSVLTQS